MSHLIRQDNFSKASAFSYETLVEIIQRCAGIDTVIKHNIELCKSGFFL